MLVQRRRDTRAALRLMRKLLKKQGFAPKSLVTDKLRSYAAAFRRLRLTCPHEQGLRKNNRAENSHQAVPTTRAQTAAVQVGPIRPALPKPARCGSQHLQLSTTPYLPIHTAELPSRSGRTVARCRRSLASLGSQCVLYRVAVIKPPRLHGPGCRRFRHPPGSSSLPPIIGRWVRWYLFGPSRKKRFLPFHLIFPL